MYVYPSDLRMVHFYGNEVHVTTSMGSTMSLADDQIKVLIPIINGISEFEEIAKVFKGKDVYSDRQNYLRKTLQIINSLGDIISVGFQRLESEKRPLISGVSGKYYPASCVISLTNRCLHRCRHCYKEATFLGVDLDEHRLEEFLLAIKGKVKLLDFTGGEPFLYEPFGRILERYHEYFSISVVTCGFWGKPVSKKTLEQIHSIQLTLYGHSAETHDAFVGVKGSFEVVKNNIRSILDCRVPLIVQTMGKTEDITELREFLDLCASLGVSNAMIGEIVGIGRAKSMDLPEDDTLMQNNIRTLQKEYAGTLNLMFDSGKGNKNTADFFACGAGRRKWDIGEDGIITPCDFFDKTIFGIGSIYDGSYMDLIDSKNEYDRMEQGWFDRSTDIVELYHSRGVEFQKICHSVTIK